MKKWYQDKNGGTSTMRIVTMVSSMIGCVALVAGGVALFMQIPDAVQYAALGAGMTGLGEIAKSWQAQKGA